MAELTEAQLTAAETMSLEELRALALQGDEAVVEEPKKALERGADGKFVAANQSDVLDNADEAEEEETQIFRREIVNEDGTMDVYEADSIEELIDKIADAKRAAVTQLKKVIAEKRTVEANTVQTTADEEFMVAEKLKKNPKATVEELVSQVIEKRLANAKAADDAQTRFLTTHPYFVPCPENASTMSAWGKTHGYPEFTTESLEKAYQDLSKSGLLKLKSEEADVVADADGKDTSRTVEPKSEAVQQRSQRKSSTIKTTSARSAPKVGSGPTEDELYAMPMEKLRDLANKQMNTSE